MFASSLSNTYNGHILSALSEVFFLREVLSWLCGDLFCDIHIEMDAKLIVDAYLSEHTMIGLNLV